MCIRFLCGKKGSLTCHMEQNDTRIFSYFVVGHAPVEGMVFCFVDLQRTRHFLEEKKNMSLLFQVFAHFLYFSFLFFLLPKVHRGNVRGTFSAKSLLMVMRSAGYWPVLLLMSLQPVHLSCASGFLWPALAERKQFNPTEVLRVAGCTKHSFFLSFVNLVLLLHYATRPSKHKDNVFCLFSQLVGGSRGGVSGGSRKRQAASVRKRLLQTREQDGSRTGTTGNGDSD